MISGTAALWKCFLIQVTMQPMKTSRISTRSASPPVALTIAGSDPSGGAGIQADLKTFFRFGVYGASVISLVTVQNTQRVSRVFVLSESLVGQQLEAVLEDLPPAAAKTGALGSRAIICMVARRAAAMNCPLVLDPVMISKHGASLMERSARHAFIERLLPCAFLVTPNLHEAEALSGLRYRGAGSLERMAVRLRTLGAAAVLIKGGHGRGALSNDFFLDEDGELVLKARRLVTRHTHGTGCTLSAAITAFLAKGRPLRVAVRDAKSYVTRAIGTSPGFGKGAGPLNHFA